MENEIKRLHKRIDSYKEEVGELHEEIVGLRQMLDIAAASIVLLLKNGETPRALSKEDIKSALGKYHLAAREEDGFYILEIVSE
ncbi:MAG: hypothetical protein IJD91_05415 [Clostridia bacterium]|nr:hypothetical protein [Clostridia bacterium]